MLNQDQLFSIGNRLIAKHTTKNVLIISFKLTQDNKALFITLLYKNNTDLNPFNNDIFFTITLPEGYPHKHPIVNCISNFAVPTYYDNRNLLYSIINHSWSYKHNQDHFTSIEEVVTKIPKLLEKILENNYNKRLVYYGEYNLNDIYEMNDFLVNNEHEFYRVVHYTKKKQTQRYVVLTGICFLLFDPSPDTKNMGKMMYVGRLLNVKKKTYSQVKNEENKMMLEFKEGEDVRKVEIAFENRNIGDRFIANVERRIKRLKDRYNTFYEGNDTDQSDKRNEIESLKEMIKDKERLYMEHKSITVKEELVGMYRQIVEMLKETDNNAYEEYVHKIKQFDNK